MLPLLLLLLPLLLLTSASRIPPLLQTDYRQHVADGGCSNISASASASDGGKKREEDTNERLMRLTELVSARSALLEKWVC